MSRIFPGKTPLAFSTSTRGKPGNVSCAAALLALILSACTSAPTGAPSTIPDTPGPSPTPSGTPEPVNLALGRPVSASSEAPFSSPATNAVDGNLNTWWAAGSAAPQWLEIDLGEPTNIAQIRLYVKQPADGSTLHRVWGKGPGDEFRLLHEFSGLTFDNQMLEYNPPQPWSDLQYLRVETQESPDGVSWREIEVYSVVNTAVIAPTPTAPALTIADRPRLDTPDQRIDSTFDYVRQFWPQLTRPGDYVSFALPGRFVVPGDAFDWFFYWDSYFIITGLVVQGEWELAREIVDDFIAEVEEFGHIPNYNSPADVCRSRSQPPYLTAAVLEVYPYVGDTDWLERAYEAARTEYSGYWLSQPHLTDSGLSRFYDISGEGCLTIPDTPHFRTIAETGWDNTPRFGSDATSILPVDLNSQLYRYEVDLAEMAEVLGREAEAQEWRERAEARLALINEFFWDEETGFFLDYDMQRGDRMRTTPRCLSAYVTLWAGVASQEQAQKLVESLPLFETDYGLATCEPGWSDGTQHNYPVGWAYSHWYATYGLRKYGYDEEAARIALKWMSLLAQARAETGAMWERYNVVDPTVPASGRYEVQEGFGWTNAVYAALPARILFGLEPDWQSGELLWAPSLPPEWQGQVVSISLPSYPWPSGAAVECTDWPASPCTNVRGSGGSSP